MKIKMYTLSTCPWCMRTKRFFKDKKVKFEYVDYDLADEKVQETIAKDCRARGVPLSFPIVIIGDKVVQGYDPEKYEELLK
jgi:glutaredoxin